MAKNDNVGRTETKIETIEDQGQQSKDKGTANTNTGNTQSSSSPSSPSPASSMLLTAEQFMIMMKEMVREMKSNPELDAKNVEEKRRLDIRRRHRVRLARAQIEQRERLQSMCNHRKGPSETAEPCLGGQVFSDGYERKICLRCQKIVIEVQAPELTAAADIMKRRMVQKAKELGIEDVVQELFNDATSQPNFNTANLNNNRMKPRSAGLAGVGIGADLGADEHDDD